MKKMFTAILSIVMLTGCQMNTGGEEAVEPTKQGICADRSNMPDVLFIECHWGNEYTGDIPTVSFIDSSGNRCITSNMDIIKLNNMELTEKYSAGELENIDIQKEYIDQGELPAIYDLICDAAEFENYEWERPDELPDVEAAALSVYAMYYTADGELRSIGIYRNKCLTSIYTNCDAATEAYKWYREAIKKN